MRLAKQTKYSVRFYPTTTAHSRPVGFKMRLLDAKKAMRVVSRLRKSGVDAVRVPQVIFVQK